MAAERGNRLLIEDNFKILINEKCCGYTRHLISVPRSYDGTSTDLLLAKFSI